MIDATGSLAKRNMNGDYWKPNHCARQERQSTHSKQAQAGKYLIPGLWDMHVHTLRKVRAETFFPLFIANGVTGVTFV